MFELNTDAIHIGARGRDKIDAIHQVAHALVKAGNVVESYVDGMLAREQQTSTWLGNGIAIPHGTLETREQILKTGVQIFQFPQGVQWDEEHVAHIVIGIAAKSDEHLGLLQQLTRVLSDEKVAQRLKNASAEELRAVLSGEVDQPALRFDSSLIMLDIKANNLCLLLALNAGQLQAVDAVDADFTSVVMSQRPLHLGQGIWLSDSRTGNRQNAIAISRVAKAFTTEDGEPVELLFTVSAVDDKPCSVLGRLGYLLQENEIDPLLRGDAEQIIAVLSSETEAAASGADMHSAEFTILNPHGLHARPSTALVKTIKTFSSAIKITRLDGKEESVNGRSLMKVIALGVTQGARLRFTATGEDALAALEAIGKIINSGLGEELA